MDRYCPNCKAKIEDGKKFCGNCGFNISDFDDITVKRSKIKKTIMLVIIIPVLLAFLCTVVFTVVYQVQMRKYRPPQTNIIEETDVPEETLLPTEVRSFAIESTRPFDGGVAWVIADDPETGEAHDFVINTDGKVLGYVEKNGNHNVIVGENGIVATPESLGYTNVEARGNGYTFVTKEVTDFENNEYYFGIVNYEGNWEIEPTRIFDKVYTVRTNGGKKNVPIIYAGEGIFQVDNTYFYNTNTHSWFEVPNIKEEANFVNGVTIVSGVVIHTDGSYSKYNVSGKLEKFSDGVIFNSSDYKLYDVNGSVVADLGYYKDKLFVNYEIVFNEGYAALKLNGEDQKCYATLIDKTGKMMFDPIKIDDNEKVKNFKNNRFCVSIATIGGWKVFDKNGNKITENKFKYSDGVYSCGWLDTEYNYIDGDGNYMFENGIINVDKEIMDKGEAL